MGEVIEINGLRVSGVLRKFVDEEALPGTGVDSVAFWNGFGQLVHGLAPKNRALLAERDRLQTELDQWHRKNPATFSTSFPEDQSRTSSYRGMYQYLI